MAELKQPEALAAAPRSRAKTSQSARSHPMHSPRSQRPNTKQMERCPLNNPDLPPVGEVEHLVERCYCFLCNCGKHVCPGASRRKTEFVKSMYSTNYHIEYYRKYGNPSKPLTLTSYTSNRLPMDLQTMKQRDFQPYKIEPAGEPLPRPPPHSVQFVSRSSYQANFPNWGPNEVIRVNRPWLPYRGDSVRLDPKTTYSESFGKTSPTHSARAGHPSGLAGLGHSKESSGSPRKERGEGRDGAAHDGKSDISDPAHGIREELGNYPTGYSNPNLRRTGGPLGTGREFYSQTTTNRAFKPFNSKQVASKEPRPNENFVPMQSPGSYLKTTYRVDYVPKELRIRPMKSKSQAALI